jgi:hypothetical protein
MDNPVRNAGNPLTLKQNMYIRIHTPPTVFRARICKLLMGPEIDSKVSCPSILNGGIATLESIPEPEFVNV